MAAADETLFNKFIGPLLRQIFNEEELKRPYQGLDWEEGTEAVRREELVYPGYYLKANYHGIRGGYMSADAAISYDPITQYALFPHENLVRDCLVQSVRTYPRRILDLGCGTGSTTLLLKQAFPGAEVVGLDLSPYMLVAARLKAQRQNLDVSFCHGDAGQTRFASHSFDLVTASLLFHETPPVFTRQVLREMYRLLPPGGECLILDGSQQTLSRSEWLMNIFEEPHIKAYAKGNLDTWMTECGFGAVETREHWFIHQVSRGVRPLGDYCPTATGADLGDVGFAGAGA